MKRTCVLAFSVFATIASDSTVGAQATRAARLAIPHEARRADLALEPWSFRAPGFQLLVQEGNGALVPMTPPAPRTLRGTVKGGASHHFYGALAPFQPDVARGVLKLDGRLWSFTAALDGRAHLTPAAPSAVPEDACVGLPAPVNHAVGQGGVAGGCGYLCEIAFDADYEYFLKLGSSVDAVVADIEEVFALVVPPFEEQLDIHFVITAIVIRTTSEDPYTSSDWVGLVEEVKAEWTTNLAGIARDVAHLMTDRELSSGVLGAAWMPGTCDFDYEYGWSKSHFTEVLLDRAHVTAHELGHNFGASHEFSDCGIMSSNFGCESYEFAPISITQITNFLTTATCLGPLAADLDGDCAVGSGDLSLLLGAWGTSGPGDLDSDGIVGAADLALLLAAWSPTGA